MSTAREGVEFELLATQHPIAIAKATTTIKAPPPIIAYNQTPQKIPKINSPVISAGN